MNIVYLHGTAYAVNLWWQVRSGGAVSRKVMLQAARVTAQELGNTFTCVVLRPQQYGLGESAPQTGVPSLAAALRPRVQKTQGFLGMFRLEEGWWVVGISRGAIAAAGDRLFELEDAARAHMRQLRDLFGESEEVTCGSPEESAAFIRPLLIDESVRVEPLFPDPFRHRKLLHIGVLVLVLVLIGLGGKALWDSRVQETAVKNARQLVQGKESRRREILADPGRHFEQRWLAAPPVMAVSALCLPKLADVPLSNLGWDLESATCRPSALVLNWGYKPGASYTRLPPDTRLADAKKAMTKTALPTLAARGMDRPLVTSEVATARLYEQTRQLGCRLKLSWAAPEKKSVQEVEVVAPWVRGTWQLEAVSAGFVVGRDRAGGDVFPLLATLPGLVVTEIVFDKIWIVKGVVYAALN